MFNTYSIYLDGECIAEVLGTEYAYEVYAKTKELADLLVVTACLVWNGTGEIVAEYDPMEV